jgi:DNA-binding NtrC family response regulator
MKKLILLPDDDERCPGLVPFLERDGYLVICAITPDQAQSLLAEGLTIDLLITEQFLPGADFMKFLDRLLGINSRFPIIVISGDDFPGARPQVKSAGSIDYLCRPFTMMDALRIVNRRLHRTDRGVPVPPANRAEKQDWSTAS